MTFWRVEGSWDRNDRSRACNDQVGEGDTVAGRWRPTRDRLQEVVAAQLRLAMTQLTQRAQAGAALQAWGVQRYHQPAQIKAPAAAMGAVAFHAPGGGDG